MYVEAYAYAYKHLLNSRHSQGRTHVLVQALAQRARHHRGQHSGDKNSWGTSFTVCVQYCYLRTNKYVVSSMAPSVIASMFKKKNWKSAWLTCTHTGEQVVWALAPRQKNLSGFSGGGERIFLQDRRQRKGKRSCKQTKNRHRNLFFVPVSCMEASCLVQKASCLVQQSFLFSAAKLFV